MEKGKIENYVVNEINKHGTLCLPLIDAENHFEVLEVTRKLEKFGVSAILLGGSSVSDQIELLDLINRLKQNLHIPIILFPGNVTGVASNADAILFTSLLNSENPYYITGAQAQGALIVKKHNLEAIPTAYLIIGENSTAWFVGQARSIPFDKDDIAIMYALAAQYMGMRFLYLEAGSGTSQNVRPEMVAAVRKYYEGILIVGGGINSKEVATKIANSGADIIVIGTMIEKEKNWENEFLNILHGIKRIDEVNE